MGRRRVLGAGLSGLTAAINLNLAGEEVVVHESRNAPGEHMYRNHQVLVRTRADVKGYLERFNLKSDFSYKYFTKALCLTNTRDIRVDIKEPLPFVQRGNHPESMEMGLARQAEAEGVNIEYRSRVKPGPGDIVSTGHYRADMAAFGAYFENDSHPRDEFTYMHDDRFSPRGWYLYIVPIGKDQIKIVNCASQPYLREVKPRLFKAIEQRKALADIIDGAKPLVTFGGIGGVEYPDTAVKDGALYTGEAAGLQDPWRGFGMNYALESGHLAARALTEDLDYDTLWKKHFKQIIRWDIARRGLFWFFGNRAFEHVLRHTRTGDTIDFNDINPHGFQAEMLYALFYRIELLKRWAKGYW